jgi:hypothetical protein
MSLKKEIRKIVLENSLSNEEIEQIIDARLINLLNNHKEKCENEKAREEKEEKQNFKERQLEIVLMDVIPVEYKELAKEAVSRYVKYYTSINWTDAANNFKCSVYNVNDVDFARKYLYFMSHSEHETFHVNENLFIYFSKFQSKIEISIYERIEEIKK